MHISEKLRSKKKKMHWIFSPILGGIIGYITNDIAIKMLFHPYKPLYIKNWHIPFTPGLIHNQKERIANSIVVIVKEHLLNSKTLQNTLLSEEVLDKLRAHINEFLKTLKNDERTLEQAILSLNVKHDGLSEHLKYIKQGAADFILERLTNEQIGIFISRKVTEEAQRLLGTFAAETIKKLGVADLIGGIVNEKIQEKMPALLNNEIDKIEKQILSLRVNDIYNYNKNEERLALITKDILDVYCSVIEKKLDKILDAVNISEIVVNKIRGFSAEELEKLVFGIMKRELGAIVYLGALLGFLMGFVNILLAF